MLCSSHPLLYSAYQWQTVSKENNFLSHGSQTRPQYLFQPHIKSTVVTIKIDQSIINLCIQFKLFSIKDQQRTSEFWMVVKSPSEIFFTKSLERLSTSFFHFFLLTFLWTNMYQALTTCHASCQVLEIQWWPGNCSRETLGNVHHS